MTSCFSLWPSQRERWNILLVGDNEVGKTSFAYRFSEDIFEESFGKLLFSGDHGKECQLGEDSDDSCIVSLSDTWVSQTSYMGIDDDLPFSHGVILMYSITSRWSFQDVARTCRQVPLDTKEDPNLVLILVGTKSDEDLSREVAYDEGAALSQELGCQAFFETSAKSGENVDAAVLAMVEALRKAESDRRMNFMGPFKMIHRFVSRFQTG